jgi:uncharacterized membrane protein
MQPGARGARRARLTRAHHPRVLAALCYAVPIVPGWVLLARERRNPFVRFHAAQSLVFFGLVAAGQAALYLLLVVAGVLIRNDLLAAMAALLVLILFLALASITAYGWATLLADCIRGDARPLPVAGRLAIRLERLSPGGLWRRRRGR